VDKRTCEADEPDSIVTVVASNLEAACLMGVLIRELVLTTPGTWLACRLGWARVMH
jgi:hypothetical protein